MDPKNDAEVSRFDFETQASSFDDRAGLGRELAAKGADAIVRRVGTEARVVEIGAGTGEIGVELAARLPRYVGLDSSPSMLEVFRQRAGTPPELLAADADRSWPIESGSVDAVFFGRVVHLLDPGHVLDELVRVAHQRGLVVLLGRRARDEHAPAERSRREMHRLLTARGLVPRSTAPFLDALVARGASPAPPEVVGRRAARSSYRRILDGWRNKSGLAGLALPRDVRDEVLDDLEKWARALGPLDAEVETEETYVLEALELARR